MLQPPAKNELQINKRHIGLKKLIKDFTSLALAFNIQL